jgi:hypothetical protein
MLVTHFYANRIPQTRTTTSAARERTTHLVCGSRRHKLKHVQTCLSTWVLPDSTPQRHAVTIPGIKLSHLLLFCILKFIFIACFCVLVYTLKPIFEIDLSWRLYLHNVFATTMVIVVIYFMYSSNFDETLFIVVQGTFSLFVWSCLLYVNLETCVRCGIFLFLQYWTWKLCHVESVHPPVCVMNAVLWCWGQQYKKCTMSIQAYTHMYKPQF